MAVTLTLEDQTVAALAARARAAGLSIEDYLRELVGQPPLHPAPAPAPAAGSVEDLHAALSELFAGDTRPLPATSLTYSREEIYDDHD